MEETPKSKNLLAEHYDKLYEENPERFGVNPELFILDAADMVSGDGEVIELGAGQGRNALALAEKGLHVTAVDISKVGVDLMNKKAHELGLFNFQTKLSTSEDAMTGEYDLVICNLMLHQLIKENAEKLLIKIKEHTKNGGINVMAIFTDKGDFAKSDTGGYFYPSSEEIQEIYKGWEIVKFTEKNSKAQQRKLDGSVLFNTKIEITARKPIN